MAKKRKKPKPGKNPKRVKNMMRMYKGIRSDVKKKPVFAGKCSGLGMFQFIAQMLEANERAAKEDKLTDASLELMLIDEYPQNKRMIEVFRTRLRTINYYRDLYNRGRLTNDKPPPVISYRYNEFGLAVNLRHSDILLSTQDRMNYAKKFYRLHSLLTKAKEKPHAQPDDPQPGNPEPAPA